MRGGKGDFATRAVTADEAVAKINGGDHVFVHGAAATPTALLDAMCARRDLEDVTLYHLSRSSPFLRRLREASSLASSSS